MTRFRRQSRWVGRFSIEKKQEHPERIAPLIAEGAAHILCGLLLIFILHLE